jgi:hypothetical protein
MKIQHVTFFFLVSVKKSDKNNNAFLRYLKMKPCLWMPPHKCRVSLALGIQFLDCCGVPLWRGLTFFVGEKHVKRYESQRIR